MPNFMTRVVLHDAGSDREIYEELHQYMEEEGFTRLLQADLGERQLPDAMYDYRTNEEITSAQVRDRAKAAAAKTGKRHAVLTVRYSALAWSGLERP